MSGADPASFKIVKGAYTKDLQHVYFRSKIIADADPQTFEPVAMPNYFVCDFAKDDKHIYNNAEVFPVKDPKTFTIIDCDKAKDATRTYPISLCCMQAI
jgi:hypothetical protein